ncbi:MAG: uncharacterized protein KVP18_003762 [Porospora cf. gigantea A]|uniref:uncharacterized protein n=1 Tax=Porospora cf. gigantea A TaxID=2853593 RepID=UPI00355A55E5|nr:MAG: hypothetical protein KVP18_003762 [Porospora cf. gigantea A]
MIEAFLAVSRQGKPRVVRFFNNSIGVLERDHIIQELTSVVIERPAHCTNTVDYKQWKLIYKRYASLFFVVLAHPEDNSLMHLEMIHHYVELLDKYFGNVCELDLIFNAHKVSFQQGHIQALFLMDEVLCGGTLMESSKKVALRSCQAQDAWMECEPKGKKTTSL